MFFGCLFATPQVAQIVSALVAGSFFLFFLSFFLSSFSFFSFFSFFLSFFLSFFCIDSFFLSFFFPSFLPFSHFFVFKVAFLLCGGVLCHWRNNSCLLCLASVRFFLFFLCAYLCVSSFPFFFCLCLLFSLDLILPTPKNWFSFENKTQSNFTMEICILSFVTE